VGPPFFNRWLAPIGLVIFALMGLAPLFGWRKTSGGSLRKAATFPVIAMLVTYVLHIALGSKLGFPAFVPKDAFYPGVVGVILQKLGSALPGITIALCAFNIAVIVQEFARGVGARRSAAEKRGETESIPSALAALVNKNRRRYGGYIVHLGIVSMFLGFTGAAWNIDRETAMVPGQSYNVGAYEVKYIGSRMCPGNPRCSAEEQSDINKRMVFADLEVYRDGRLIDRLSPAKFIYHRQPESPTTEVALLRTIRDDLYTIIGTIDPQSKRATFQLHVNPLVNWIWIGLIILIGGASISLWPEFSFGEVGAWGYVRAGAGVAVGTMFAVYLAMTPSLAYAKPRPDPMASIAKPPQIKPQSASLPPFVSVALSFGLALGLGFVVTQRQGKKK
jgi:cytochrome c-type biogenesis protein CcmF